MTEEEHAAIIRSMIQHEDTLIDHRITWMWTLQGLLVAAVALMWKIYAPIIFIICTFGAISCVSVGLSLQSAQRAIRALLKDWSNRPAPRSVFKHRVIGAAGKSRFEWLHPWNVLPWVMVLVWIAMAIARITYEDVTPSDMPSI